MIYNFFLLIAELKIQKKLQFSLDLASEVLPVFVQFILDPLNSENLLYRFWFVHTIHFFGSKYFSGGSFGS